MADPALLCTRHSGAHAAFSAAGAPARRASFLSRAEKPEFAATSILYYRVDDVAAAAWALESRGVTVLEPSAIVHRDARHELWMAFFRDSEGNHLALMAEVPLPPA